MSVSRPSRLGRPLVTAALAATGLIGSSAHWAAAADNYLIITAADYNNSTPLNQLSAARQAGGCVVRTYVPAAGETNTTIRNYVVALWGTPDEPDYILIVGDTSGATATAATVPHFTGAGSKHAATDWPYGCMPGGIDWYPDIPVGRLSVASVAALGDVVNKILTVESGNYPNPDYWRRAAFLANADTQGTAEPTHDWVIDTYLVPNDYEGIRIYAAQGGSTAQVTQAVNTGCLWTVYFGHSSSTGWWSPAFYQNNVNALNNTGLYGVALGWSCNTSRYTEGECFGETWLRTANKGAAAYISASNYIYWGSWEAWQPSVHAEKGFFAAFFEDNEWEIGPAWLAGLYRFLRTYGGWDGDPNHLPPLHLDECQNFAEEFVILGDPALMLPHGSSFRLRVTPEVQSICLPGDALYTIDVDPISGFSEVVSLDAQGAPPGATVSFSVNHLVPPFTSIMTVGNLGASPPGSYTIAVRGVATAMQRVQPVQLALASAAPPAVVLTSPPDGANDIPLTPELVWSAAAQASQYTLEVARDAGFTNIVYTASTSGTSRVVETPLTPVTRYHWRVRAENACGPGAYSPAWSFTTASRVRAVTYDMLNGETGQYTYFDDIYNGSGNPTQPLSPLSGGLGELTDGVIATQNWNSTSGPYVGWHTIIPTITFHFAAPVRIHTVKLYVDDSNGAGGVYPPADVRLTMGGTVLNFPGEDPPGGQPFALVFGNLNLQGTALEVRLGRTGSNYLMISEAEFYGGPLYRTGDLNCDGAVDFDDINPFVLALSDPPGYAQHYPSCNIQNGDINGDGRVDFDDINPFVALLTGGA
ncbi:MAG: C25 family cysteine peptidase [Planctomycetota bacterium]